ncbi:unnamed protein product [Anisakis simplex]|uniref:J domain-containing protein n=1 Tax=Anisakis simplex TaxID=6269 RepID=A0A0M3K1H3_ANISI|nr:unnamed protein product [Anisakis simplex]
MFFHHMNGGARSRDGPVDTYLYDVLNVRPNASESEIKKAYHHLAKEYHPDKNPAHGDRFKEISFAYEVLSNKDRRDTYDMYGMDGLKEGGGGGGFSGAEDLFSSLFEGGGGSFASFFGGGGRRRQTKGADMNYPLTVTLEDLYNGKTSKLQLSKKPGMEPGDVIIFVNCKEHELLESIIMGRPRAIPIPQGDDCEEVSLMPYDEGKFQNTGRREAYDDDDDEEDARGGGGNVQCHQS